ncbi:MAG TPA: hypothetical protein PLP20_04350, partial [Oscillospiraceae bacterium]|nr:hypothetical protein [Oscillospiraceae bacterium]
MKNDEKVLSDYLDGWNQRDGSGKETQASPEMKRLLKTAGMVRGLREPEMPEAGYAGRLSRAVAERLDPPKKAHAPRRRWFVGALAGAEALVIALGIFFFHPFANGNIVYAMEKSFENVKAYHGVLTVVETNAAGESTTQARLEVWADQQGHYYEKGLSGAQQGLVTVNNGEQKWQLRPSERQAILFPAAPDPYQFTFDLGREITAAKGAVKAETAGNGTVCGRAATILEVTPQGGEPYRIWVDKETNLPLQRQSAMQNAIRYTVTYSRIEFAEAIPAELLSYSLPEGYEQIEESPEQEVANLEEAQRIVGFMPKTVAALPEGYAAAGIRVELNTKAVKRSFVSADGTKTVWLLEQKAAGALTPASTAVLGKLGGELLEIQSPVGEAAGVLGGGPYAGVTGISSLRWQRDGCEYALVGSAPLAQLKAFAESLTGEAAEIPGETAGQPQIKVPVDMGVEKADQRSVDAGSSPWRLDPVYVAQVFASLQLSPEGITGDYPIAYEDLSLTENTGVKAVVEVAGDKTPVHRVYLERLVRQDSTGVWTVTGYDPADQPQIKVPVDMEVEKADQRSVDGGSSPW